MRLLRLMPAIVAIYLSITPVLAQAQVPAIVQAQSIDDLYRRGVAAQNSDNYVEAEAIWRQVIRLRPNDPDAYHNLGTALVVQNKTDDAIVAYRRAIELAPNDAFLYNALGTALALQRNFDDAIAAYRRAIELNPNQGVFHDNLRNALVSQGNLDEAIKLAPNDVELYNNLGIELYHNDNFDDAIAAFRRAIELGSNDATNATLYNNLGAALLEKKNFDDAIAAYRRAIELEPNYADPYNGLGNALLVKKNFDDAIAAYRRAIELEPDYAQPYIGLGNALQDQGNLDDAIAAYHRAIELDPNNEEPYNNLGNTLQKYSNFDDAIVAYHRAIELDPNNATLYNGLGSVLHNEGNLNDATAAYRRAIELDSTNALFYNNLGGALTEQGIFDDAIVAYQRAIELAPNNAVAYANLGVLYSTLQQFDKAISWSKRALALSDVQGIPATAHVLAYSTLGSALRAQGKLEEAIMALEAAIDLAPYDVRASNNLIEARRALELAQPDQPAPVSDIAFVPSVRDQPLVTILRPTARIITSTPTDGLGGIIGAGWVFRREGSTVWLVTNRHVVTDRLSDEPGETIEVEFFSSLSPAQRPRYRAILQNYTIDTEALDLAVLRIEGVPEDILALTMRPGRVQRGAEVEIIGHPFNEPDAPWSKASGEVGDYYPDRIEIDADVAIGYSGGPVFLEGSQEVIAIVFAIRSQGDAAATADRPLSLSDGTLSIGEICVTYPIEMVIEKLREWGVYN